MKTLYFGLTIFVIILCTLIIIGFNNENTERIINEINASKRLEQIQDRAYQQLNPETQILLEYVVFSEPQT